MLKMISSISNTEASQSLVHASDFEETKLASLVILTILSSLITDWITSILDYVL